jgi:hypothetical protein
VLDADVEEQTFDLFVIDPKVRRVPPAQYLSVPDRSSCDQCVCSSLAGLDKAYLLAALSLKAFLLCLLLYVFFCASFFGVVYSISIAVQIGCSLVWSEFLRDFWKISQVRPRLVWENIEYYYVDCSCYKVGSSGAVEATRWGGRRRIDRILASPDLTFTRWNLNIFTAASPFMDMVCSI